jgi:sialate O-acetylesterase
MLRPVLGWAVFAGLFGCASAAVSLASPFGDHMVLQQGQPVPVWGTAAAGEAIVVEFAGQTQKAIADSGGRWRVALDCLEASGEPRTLTVKGAADAPVITFNDVLVGEVWICGGQSNMEYQMDPPRPLRPITNGEQEMAAAKFPLIRQFSVSPAKAYAPQSSTGGRWIVCSPATVGEFTAVGYFFARDLHLARGVPVGIIFSSVGGTAAEAWTSREALGDFPEFKDDLAQVDRTAADPAAAKRHHEAAMENWYRTVDPGSGEPPWQMPAFEPAGWETMTLPALWERAGHRGFNGLVWFRKSFDLPAGWAGRDLELRLSAVDDADVTWVNGVQVGFGSVWNQARVYRIPAAVLKSAGNVLAVRVLDTSGDGGIWHAEFPLELAPVDGSSPPLSLAGPWLCRFAWKLEPKRGPPLDVTNSNPVPAVYYNSMIAPLVPYAIRGVAFYQGETNAGRARQYRTLFPALIADWRRRWDQGDFPFLFVQVAPFRGISPGIREAQLLAWQATKNTAMVVTVDCGDAADIHPTNKQPVGARLALAARALAYDEKLEYSGPLFASMETGNGRAVLRFTHLGGGLVAKDGPLTGFTVAGSDGVFHPAQADVMADSVVVSAAGVVHPVAVRYAWANVASGNLFNAAGLPASPFRTDVD